MAIVKFTGPAFFYVVMSAGLNHGHSLWFEHSELTSDGFVLVDLPLVGKLDCHQSDWNEERQEYIERQIVLGVREVHILHQLQGRLVNREAIRGSIAGMEGWIMQQSEYYTTYSHRTATGRLRFKIVVSGWGGPPTHSSEMLSIEVCAGDGKTVAAVRLEKGIWQPFYGDAEGLHGGSDEMSIEAWLAAHNANQRPDRFFGLSEILFGPDGEWLLPGESLADVKHWGVGAALRACLEGTAFDIADQYKGERDAD